MRARSRASCASEGRVEAIGDHKAAIPEIDGRLEPLCAVYSFQALASLQESLHGGELALQRAVASLDHVCVPEISLRAIDPELRSFENLNTLQDLKRFLSQ